MIAARAVQGLGAALLVPGSLAIISSSFPVEERGRAIGTWSGFSAITAAVGPVLGGWLIEHVSWRAVFFINLPLALLVIAISLWRVPESSSREKTSVDWWGAILGALGLGALVYGLIESSRVGFKHPSVVLSLTAASALLALFLIIEAKISQPMLPLTLFRSCTFAGANLLTFLLYSALGGTLFFLPLNLIQVQHYAPTAAGAALLPLILIIFPPLALVRWAGRKMWPEGSVGRRSLDRRRGLRALFKARCRGRLLEHILSGHRRPRRRDGRQRGAPHDDGDELRPRRSGRRGFRHQQRDFAHCGLLAIAVLGIVMLQSFNRTLDQRLSGVPLSASAGAALAQQRDKLAGVELPPELDPGARQFIRGAIEESFIGGFRGVMALGVLLAVGSAVSAAVLIQGGSRKG